MQLDDRFEDLASGYEYQCIGVGVRYPGLEGRLVLQDLQWSSWSLPKSQERIEQHLLSRGPSQVCSQRICPVSYANLVYSHFPLFCYLSRVFHDWPYDKCVYILQNLQPAMTSASRVS
ncbi:hypothetical protein BDW60DRAFT_197212 [Aspergillus nidulans var. acristatus]